MSKTAIFLPLCAQTFLTLVVWVYLFVCRNKAMKLKRAGFGELSNADRATLVFKDAEHPSDNFENLFEMPVLLYAGLIVVHLAGLDDSAYVIAAWVYVALRALHSFIHCSYNNVLHRFSVYLVSSLIVWAIWIRLTIQLISA